MSVEERQPHHAVRLGAVHIDCLIQPHHPFGQRTGLVGAEHIHAAEVLDGAEPPDDHAALCHLLCSMRKRHADDGRQQLRRQPNRQRQRKQQGVNSRLRQ